MAYSWNSLGINDVQLESYRNFKMYGVQLEFPRMYDVQLESWNVMAYN